MKQSTIKSFAFFLIALFIVFEFFISYSYFQDSKENISKLIKDNIQEKIFNIKHFLEKNLQIHSINNVVTYLDNIVSVSEFIEDIHIYNNTQKLVYSTKRDNIEKSSAKVCANISAIMEEDIYKQQCFAFSIKLYDKLNPFYYSVYIYLNNHHINEIITSQIQRYSIIFFLFIIFYIFLSWYILKKYLIQPLNQLGTFAYYSVNEPSRFKIKELETIRYSLKNTFKRLKTEQEELYKISTQDPLSGLYNRLSLLEKINWLISKNKRTKKKFAIIFIDLDDFKNINDSKGHEFGDKILQKIANILLETVRKNDIVSRFGGDEFVIVLPEFKNETEISTILTRIQEQLHHPIESSGIKYYVTASMGIAIFPKDGEDASTLLKNADIAMYKAKEHGKNNYYFFTEELNQNIQEKMHIKKLIHEGLREHYFQLYYQPKVDISTGKIIACEALIRLIHPEEGIIPPNKFISIAEAHGMIIPLGTWIIQEATKQLKAWENTPLKDIKISINISGIQFQDENLFKHIQNAVEDIDPTKLDIELTESILLSDLDTKLETIKKIKQLGISFSLDDFGTGFSSLSYLKNIPFDTVKIDKSFIDDIDNEKDRSFVSIIIQISKNFNLEVVAEGVETKEQLEYLKKMDCDIYQGYYCSRPLPKNDFEQLIYHSKCT